MTEELPSRPFGRTLGALDAFVAQIAAQHLPDEAAPGTDVDVSGWIVDPEFDRCEAAWIELGGEPVRVTLDRHRRDVARAYSLEDRIGANLGFAARIRVPEDIPKGTHEARVFGRTATGSGVYAATARKVHIAYPRIVPRAMGTPRRVDGMVIRIADTQNAPHTHGRGSYTIRAESSLRLSGRAPRATLLYVSAAPVAGAAVAWEFPCDADGRFDAMLWTGGLDRGLYWLTVAYLADRTAHPIAWFEIDIAGPHHLPPLHLGALRTRPEAGILHYADASPRAAPVAGEGFIAGHPIGVAGWCVDPVAHLPALAVYFQVDDLRPVPFSHHLPDPRPSGDGQRCGFGGIIDTTRLEPGTHRVRLLGAAVGGSGWYIIDDREIDLIDHHAAQTIAGTTAAG